MLLVLALSACGPSFAPSADEPGKVAAIAKAVRAHPENAGAILADHSLTTDSFDNLLYEIARDPAKTAAYTAALK